ncbi:MAG: efflux RND transporter periplasmic adaptor subunit [Gammaproteobacteria bacterium]
MRRLRVWLPVFIIAGVLGIYLAHLDHGRAVVERPATTATAMPSGTAAQLVTITRGPLSVWSVYDGQVEARDTISISSHLGGSAVIVYLAAEGADVKRGDVLARFDNTDVERNLVQLKQDAATAKSTLASLEHAVLPIERNDMELDVQDQSNKVKLEDKFMHDSEALVKEGLMSVEELSQERMEADKEHRKLAALQSKLDLTIRYEQPLRIQQARAKLLAAEEALRIGERQLANSTIVAPEAGVVEYHPLAVGGEYRSVHVGDTVFQNQTFMSLPNPHSLIVHCEVPESEFDQVPVNADVIIQPLSRPDLRFQGRVESVGSMARSVPDQPGWQRYFQTLVKVQDGAAVLRPGMSVTATVLSYHTDNAVLLPRQAVYWADGAPYVMVQGLLGAVRRPVKLGRANQTRYEVLEGLSPGDQVRL